MGSAIQNDKNRFPLFYRVKNDHDINVYIEEQNKSLHAMGYTEHSFAHIGVVADRTAYILDTIGVDDHTIDLALTASWMLFAMGDTINPYCPIWRSMSRTMSSVISFPLTPTRRLFRRSVI